MKEKDLEVILSCSLFRDVEKPRLLRDLESLPYRMSSFNEGKIVLLRNDPYDDLLIILAGRLDAFQEDREGHHLIVESLKAPEAVATAILFAPRARISVSLKGAHDGRLFLISRKSLLWLCSRHSGILTNLLHDMGARAAFLAERLRYQAFASIRQKLAIYLLEQIDLGELDIPVSKEHLAEVFGVSRPSLSRVCRELVDQKLIRLNSRRLVILKPDGIRSLAESLL